MNLQSLLNKWKIKADINMLLDMWREPQRHYHDISHLLSLFEDINRKYEGKEWEKLTILAIFHDIIYDPKLKDNEEKSAEFFYNLCEDKSNTDIIEIKQSILDTKYHTISCKLSETFNKLDMSIVEQNYDRLLEWEDGIYNEYKFMDNYKEKRIKFLESLLDKYNHNADNILKLIKHVKNK